MDDYQTTEDEEEAILSQQFATQDLVHKLKQALEAVEKDEWEDAEDALVSARGMLEAYTYGYPNPTGLLSAISEATEHVKNKEKDKARSTIRQAINLAEKLAEDEDQEQNAEHTLASHIRAARQKRGLSVQQAVEKLPPDEPLTIKDWQRIEQGDMVPNEKCLRAIAQVLNISPQTLLDLATEARKERSAQADRTTLATHDISPSHDEFKVTIITAGEGNGFTWPEDVLANYAHLFNGITAFVNHERIDAYNARPGGRTVDDIAGVYYNAHFDPQVKGIRAQFKPMPPRGEWTAKVINAILEEKEKGTPVPNIGISADVSFTHRNRVVSAIKKVHSADIVFNPARGPQSGEAFARIANQVQESLNMNNETSNSTPPTAQVDPAMIDSFLKAQRQALLHAQLANSNLPEPMKEAVREQLGEDWLPEDLDRAISQQKKIWAKLQEDKVITGVQPSTEVVSNGWDQFEEAFLALIEARRPKNGIRPLSGIREAYLLLSGDYEMTGMFHEDRVQFANASSTTMANLTANVLNKVVVNQFQRYPRFWEPVVYTEEFTSLQTVQWITLGGIGELPTVAEGAAYTEMTWDDQSETASWKKKGGYLGITLEAIDKDDTRRLQQAPRALAQAAWLTLGKAFAAIFTDNNALSDGVALFHANHNNLGSSGLGYAAWDATRQAMRAQTELNSSEPLGALTAPKFLLVPNELEQTAIQTLASANEPGTADNDINPFAEGESRSEMLRIARQRVIVVDFWTNAKDWVAVADPNLYPSIGLGYRFGDTPEIFSVADPNSGLMFTNDVMPVKVRWFFAIGPTDYRGLYKHVVA